MGPARGDQGPDPDNKNPTTTDFQTLRVARRGRKPHFLHPVRTLNSPITTAPRGHVSAGFHIYIYL